MITVLVTSLLLIVAPCHSLLTDHGRCEPITIPFCKGLKYNMTRMPNSVGQNSQKEAALQVNEYIPLVQFGCSPMLRFFLCSQYAPMCTEQVDETMVIPACRSMCLAVKSKCEPVLEKFNFPWPPALDCSQLPESGDRTQLCIDPPSADVADDSLGADVLGEPISHNPEMVHLLEMLRRLTSTTTTSSSNRRPFETGHLYKPSPDDRSRPVVACGQRYVAVQHDGNQSYCAPRCQIDVLYRSSDKKFTEIWMTVWSVVCLLCTSLTFLTFLINTSRFRYPERPVIMVAVCSAVYSSAYILRAVIGPNAITCQPHPTDATSSFLVSGDLKATWCIVVFIVLYFCGMAAILWWVILTITFYLSAGRKWGREAVEASSIYFHVAVWSLATVQTAVVLGTRRFDADELTGLCYVGSQNSTSLVAFVIVPLLVYLVVGVGFIGAGFLAMLRIRSDLRHQAPEPTSVRKFEQLMAKIGIFSVLFTVPAICVVACCVYRRLNVDEWQRVSQEADCGGGGVEAQPADCALVSSIGKVEVEVLQVFMLLAAGTTTVMWICSCKTLDTWQQFFRRSRREDKRVAAPVHVSTAQRGVATYRKCDGGVKSTLLNY